MHQALAEVERAGKRLMQRGVGLGADIDLRHRQLDRVLLEARQPRPLRRGEVGAIDAQGLEALLRGPLGEVRVVALACHDERRQQRDARAAMLAQQPRGDRGGALRLDGDIAIGAVLGAELHVEQPQEVMDLGQRRDRALAAAAAGALLDGDRRRNAEYRVHVGPGGGLHELPRIGVE